MPKPELLQRYAEHKIVTAELAPLQKKLQEYNAVGWQVFWEQNKEAIAAELKQKYTISPNPDIEIISPIHKNAQDLPLLLWSMAGLEGTENKSVQITLIMHNNSGNSETESARDPSWESIEELQRMGVPLSVKEFSHPMLTGPYASWQYGLATSTGEVLCVVDADSLLPPSWLNQITKPLADNKVLFTGATRVLVDTDKSIAIPSKAYNYLASMQHVLLGGSEPHLAKKYRFAGGQAAYRGEIAREVILSQLGQPTGDGHFAQVMLKRFGDDSFSFATAPALNKADNHRKATSPIDYIKKVSHAARAVLPPLQSIIDKVLPPADVYESGVGTSYRYVPWTRPLIDFFTQQGSITKNTVLAIIEETATQQHYEDNVYLQHFLITAKSAVHIETITTHRELLELIFELAERIVVPTFRELVFDKQKSESN